MKKTAVSATDTLKSSSQNSACCIIPPYELWDSIQAIRIDHDKSYPKWPVHINIMWPFVPNLQFDEAETRIRSNLGATEANFRPFRIRLARFAYNPGSKYLYLVPEVIEGENKNETQKQPQKKATAKKNAAQQVTVANSLERLVKVVQKALPLIASADEGHKSPHLSVGQFDQTEIERNREELQATWIPIEFEVTELSFISRDSSNENFNVRKTIPLTV